MDRSLLNKATSSDDVPTAGYVYAEIAKSTFGDPAVCQQLADYLLKRLERDHPIVKMKALQIIRHVCDQGKPDFRRAVQKKSEVVKACTQYRGTPDPLKGDANNKAVRDEAEAAVKAIFSADSQTNAYGMNAESGKKMQGFGSEASAAETSGGFSGGASHAYSGSKTYGGSSHMVGFGNPNFDNSVKEDRVSMFKQTITNSLQALPRWPGGRTQTTSNEPNQPSSYKAPTAHGMDTIDSSRSGSFGSGGPWRSQNELPRKTLTSQANESGEYEGRLVSEFCMPGGPRVAPSPQALEEFCQKCKSLNALTLGQQIGQQLANGDWRVRLKALHVVEGLSQYGLDDAVGYISDNCSESLFEAQVMPQCRQKAQKVLCHLGFIEQPDERHSQPRREAAAVPANSGLAMKDDLLMNITDEGPSNTSTITNVQPVHDLLGNLDAPNIAAPSTSGSVGPLDLGIGNPITQPAPVEHSTNLFGDLSIKSTPDTMDISSVSTKPRLPSMPGRNDRSPVLQPSEPPSLLAALQGTSMQVTTSMSTQGSGVSLFDQLQLGGTGGGAHSAPVPMPQQSFSSMMDGIAGPSHDHASRIAHLNILSGSRSSVPGGLLSGSPFGVQPFPSMTTSMQQPHIMQPQQQMQQLQQQQQQHMFQQQMMQQPQIQPQLFMQPPSHSGGLMAGSGWGPSSVGSAFGFVNTPMPLATGGIPQVPVAMSPLTGTGDLHFSFVADEMKSARR